VSKTQFDFKDKRFPLLVSTKAFGMGVDHRWLRFIIHYGFSSSIEAYYQEVGRAGRDKNHAHCALLVRIPHEKCLQLVIEGEDSSEGAVEDVALPGCMKSTYLNKRQCPPEIGLPEPCDFSRQLRMILDYYVKPEGFAKSGAEFWAELTSKQRDEENRVFRRICGGGIGGEKRVQRTQNQLFRLQQLGIVKRFMLKYKPHYRHFDVTFNVWLNKGVITSELIKNLRIALIKIRLAPDDEIEPDVVKRHEDRVDEKLAEVFEEPIIRSQEAPTQRIVELAILTLFKDVRRYVLRMRLTSFKRLLNYVMSNDQCRRKELLGAMTAQEHGTDTYSCNFCDSTSCVPDLHFNQEKATSAPQSGQHDDIFAGQDDAMRKEDIGQLEWAWQEAVNQKLVGAFGQKAVARLEFDPDNPMANLAAAESYARNPDPELRRSAHGFFRSFAKIANLERKDSEMARRGYSGYKAFDPTEAIRAFAEPESALDELEHVTILDTDAENTDLKAEEKYALKSVRYAKQFKSTTKSFLEDSDLQEALSDW
jgi:ATP-dependent DNA helicase RecQ